ncbi:MAG: FGGY family carbohydrate kinase [Lentisphaeria bacterium]
MHNHTQNTAVLALDLGTSSFKCGSFNSDLEIIAVASRKIVLQKKNDEQIELDFEEAWQAALTAVAEVSAKTRDAGFYPEAIVITSQAQTFAPVNTDFAPLQNGISWLDRRAVSEAHTLAAELTDFPQTAGLKEPTPGILISKLLWLKNNEPATFAKAAHFPLLNEFIATRFTSIFFSDSTNLGMSGIYNISQRKLNNKVLSLLGLEAERFAPVYRALGNAEPITDNIRNYLDLPHPVQVYLAGNDQSTSAVGAGLQKKGDVTVNFGTALVFYTILDQPPRNLEKNHIAGINPINDKFFLLLLNNEFGSSINQAREQFFPAGSYEDVYQSFRKCAREDAFIPLTAPLEIFKDKYQDKNPIVRAGSLVNYFIEQIRLLLHSISTHVQPAVLLPSGGAAESETFLSILQERLPCPVLPPRHAQESGLRGTAELYYKKSSNH